MWKYVLVATLILSGISSFVVIRYGMRPKSVPVIRPSNFESGHKLGEYIYRQMYQVLSQSTHIAFGYDPKSAFQKEAVDHIKAKFGSSKTYYDLDVQNAYHRNESSKILELEKQLQKNIPSFVFEDLENVTAIAQLQDCSSDLRFQSWMRCLKENKLRQISISKKVLPHKISAVFDRISERSWAAFINYPNTSN